LVKVENLGEEQALRADCTVLNRRNDQNPLHRSTFGMEWAASEKRIATLPRGSSCNLVVAKASEIKGRPTEARRPPEEDMNLMQIWGLSGQGEQGEEKESSRWYYGDKLPEYDLKITVTGENQKPHVECFTLKAGRASALEMFAIPCP